MQAWEEFLKAQQKELGVETTERWLRSLKVVHFDACNLYLEAKDAFQILWFEEHIRPQVRLQLLNNNNHSIKVHLSVGGDGVGGKHLGKNKKSTTASPSKIINFPPDVVDSYATFEQFVAVDSSQIPCKLLYELTRLEKNQNETALVGLATFNPIYIYGAAGVGKTHLLMAVANSLMRQKLSVFFVKAETFTDHVVKAIKNSSMQDFRNAYRHVDILIIDDVHLFARKSATQEEFFNTFNALHTAGKQVILSANTSPQLLEEIEARLISRFEWGIALHLEKMTPPQSRQLILKRCQTLNFFIKDEIIDFLIKTFAPNTKTLQKALDTLVLRVHLDNLTAELSLTKALEFLSELIEYQKETALNPSKIIRAVAIFYGITKEDILGKSQSHDCSLPRQIAMFLCRKELKIPFIKIGNIFARDHSTVMSSVRQIEKKVETQDKETCSAITDILRRLN